MAAKIWQSGFSTVGFNSEGQMAKVDLKMLVAGLPSEQGEWVYIYDETQKVYWIHALPEGNGYIKYDYPDLFQGVPFDPSIVESAPSEHVLPGSPDLQLSEPQYVLQAC